MSTIRRTQSEPNLKKKNITQTDIKRSGSKVRFDESSTETFFVAKSRRVSRKIAQWYTPKELHNLREVCPAQESNNECKKRRTVVIKGVLEQQSEHQNLGIQDPKGLRVLYRRCTKVDRELAVKSALHHANEVLNAGDEVISVHSDDGIMF